MANIREKIKEALQMARDFPLSMYGAATDGKAFDNVETFFIFVGYPRSGHTLIGSLLDAHPEILCGHELSVLNYVQAGFSKKQIFHLLNQKSQHFTREGRSWNGYSYQVPGQWQGNSDRVRIIGDKKAAGSTFRLKTNPGVLKRLEQLVNTQPCIVHVIRNPYDNITTISRKHDLPLDAAIDWYFSLCESVLQVKEQVDKDLFFEMHHEAFISDVEKWLGRLCRFLGAEPSEAYLKACADIVFPSPKQTRRQLTWSPGQIQQVERQMATIPYLAGYCYDEPV